MSENLDFANVYDIVQFYQRGDDAWLRANMILSLDGNYVGPGNSSRDLSNQTDLLVLQTLRALSDAVLVGAKTAIGEKYRHTPLRNELLEFAPRNPPFVIVSRSLDLPLEAPIFADNQHKPHIITHTQSSPSWIQRIEKLSTVAHVWSLETSTLTGSIIRSHLSTLGFNRVTCEGGPQLLEVLVESKAIDELALTIGPAITGNLGKPPSLGQSFRRLIPINQHLESSYLFQRFNFE